MLVIEDDPSVAQFAHRQLVRRGYGVAIASTCAEARQLYECGMRFAIALVDVGLPDGSGLALGEELVASGAVRHVVYYTGLDRDGASERSASGRLSGPIISKGDGMHAVLDALGELPRRDGSATDPQAAIEAHDALSQPSATIVDLEDGLLTVDTNPDWIRAWVSGRELALSPDSSRLLRLFVIHRGTLFPKHRICELALDKRVLSDSSIYQKIHRLRAQLREAAYWIREQRGCYGIL